MTWDWGTFPQMVLAAVVGLSPIEGMMAYIILRFLYPTAKWLKQFTGTLSKEETALLVKRLRKIADREIQLERQYGEENVE